MNDQEKSPEIKNALPRRVRFGPYEVDFHTQEFLKHGIRSRLSGQPFQVLEALLSRPGELVTRAELQQKLWSTGTFADFNHSLNAAVKKLREALNDSADNPKYVETLPRRGYRFIGLIETGISQPRSPAAGPCQPTPAPSLPRTTEKIDSALLDKEIKKHAAVRRGAPLPPVLFGLLCCCLGVFVFTIINLRHTRQSTSEQQTMSVAGSVETKGSMRDHKKLAAEMGGRHETTVAVPVVLRQPAGTRASRMLRTIIPGYSNNAGPQFSPDGKRIAFMSNRSGNWQIWVSAADGSNPIQLTYGGGAGTPRWSPDGRSIAYDGVSNDGTSIFLIFVDKREPEQRLVNGLVPSFSRNGKWIYFASDRDGDWQVWKTSFDGRVQKRVTSEGGFSAQESSDGYVYFSKSRYPNPRICRVPVQGGSEECTLQHLRPRTWSSWAVTRDGILFVEDLPEGSSELSFYEPAKRQVSSLITLPSAPLWMGATADGKKAIMNDREERQISAVDNLR